VRERRLLGGLPRPRPHLRRACVDPAVDPRNCGGCGRDCAAAEACVAGVCHEARRCEPAQVLDDAADRNNDGASLAGLAGDGGGNAFVAWRQLESGSANNALDFAQRFDAAADAWGPRALLTDQSTGNYQPIYLAVANGAAVAAWDVRAGAAAARFDPASGTWGAPQLLAAFNVGGAAVDGHGNIVVDGWDQTGAWTSSVRPGPAAFPPARYVPLPSLGIGFFSSAARDRRTGNLTVFVSDTEGGAIVVRALSFDAAGLPAAPPAAIGSFSSAVKSFTLSPDGRGGAIVAWAQDSAAGTTDIWVTRLAVAGATWSPPALVESDPDSLFEFPSLTVGADGGAFLLWYRRDDSGTLGLRASTLAPGATAWDAPVHVQDGLNLQASISSYGPPVGTNGAGDAATATGGAGGGVWLTLFDGSRRAWGPPALIADVPPARLESSDLPILVSLADDRSAVVAWQAYRHVWASRCK
jgi:hypothetical protein